jgi:hypothetical protein
MSIRRIGEYINYKLEYATFSQLQRASGLGWEHYLVLRKEDQVGSLSSWAAKGIIFGTQFAAMIPISYVGIRAVTSQTPIDTGLSALDYILVASDVLIVALTYYVLFKYPVSVPPSRESTSTLVVGPALLLGAVLIVYSLVRS